MAIKASPWIMIVVPCAFFRFVVFAPTIYYQGLAEDHQRVISGNEILHNGTYNPAFVTGEQLANKWGTFLFYWNIAAWLPTIWLLPPLGLPLVIVDTATTVYLSIATYYQTGYTFHDKNSCSFDAVQHFQRPPTMNESFWSAAGRLNGTATTPVTMCREFVVEWQYGVALCFFYALISLLGILGFCGSMKDAKKEGKSFRTMLKEMGIATCKCLLGLQRLWIGLVALILYYIPLILFRCLPLNFRAPVRSVRRHVVKTGIGAEQKAEIMMMELQTEYSKRMNVVGRYQGGDGQQTPNALADFLGIYDMLILVTGHLHYIDVINLSRVSKSVRESVLPSQDHIRRLTVFKVYTCLPDQKLSCWACTNQICSDCQQLPLVPQTTALHHLDNCQPYCTPCYQTHILRHRPSTRARVSDPYCKCAPEPARPRNLYNWFMNGSTYYTKVQKKLHKLARPVCRECNKLPSEGLLTLREKRAKLDLKLGLKNTGEKWTNCARTGCRRDLGTGPRYWICKKSDCEKECTSTLHKALGRGHGGEAVVGEEAV